MMEVAFMLLLIVSGLCLGASLGAENTSTVFRFSPQAGVKLFIDEIKTVPVTGYTASIDFTVISVKIKDQAVAKIAGNSSVLLRPIDCAALNNSDTDSLNLIPKGNHCFNFSFTIEGIFLGRSSVEFHAGVLTEEGNPLPISYDVAVLRPDQKLRDIFTFTLLPLICLNMIGFGCTIDLSEMWKIMKKPIAPAIGLGCQFILNPLISYGLGKAIDLDFALALGLFALGCSPGGGGSNLWSYLLDGDVNLSILMTFLSTVVSFGTLPLWMYTLGKSLIPAGVTVPFERIFFSLLAFVVPCVFGILIKRFAPKVAKVIRKVLKAAAVIFLLVFLPLGIYTNWYVFTLFRNWKVVLCGCLFPYSGYIISAGIAWIARQSPPRILTICIETAIQNAAIAIIIILTTFPQPEAEIAAVMPIVASMFTPIPLITILVATKIRKRCCNSEKDGDATNRPIPEENSSAGSSTKPAKSDEKNGLSEFGKNSHDSHNLKKTSGTGQQIVGLNYTVFDNSIY